MNSKHGVSQSNLKGTIILMREYNQLTSPAHYNHKLSVLPYGLSSIL